MIPSACLPSVARELKLGRKPHALPPGRFRPPQFVSWPAVPGVMIAVVGFCVLPVFVAMPETAKRSPPVFD